MENPIYNLMLKAGLQNMDSYVTLVLTNESKVTGQIVDFTQEQVLIADDAHEEDCDVKVISTDIIYYFECGANYFKK